MRDSSHRQMSIESYLWVSWHMENETWNTLPEKQTDPSWRCLGSKQKPCRHRLGMASARRDRVRGLPPPSFLLLLSIFLSFLFLYNEFLVCYQQICAQTPTQSNSTASEMGSTVPRVRQTWFKCCLPDLLTVACYLGRLPNPPKYVSPSVS